MRISPKLTPSATNQNLIALLGACSIFLALIEHMIPKPLPFLRIGIANLPVKIVGSISGFLSDGNGPTHQALEDVSIMRGIPNVNVFCPADENDMMQCLPKIYSDPNPFYIRFNANKGIVEHSDFEIGKAEVFGEGKEIVILVYGFLFTQAFKSKEILESKGYSVRLINIRTPKPIDEQTILKAVDECKLIVTIEDHFITGGLYTILAEVLLKHKRTADILPFALMNKWFKPGLLNDVLDHEGFTAEKIADSILTKLK